MPASRSLRVRVKVRARVRVMVTVRITCIMGAVSADKTVHIACEMGWQSLSHLQQDEHKHCGLQQHTYSAPRMRALPHLACDGESQGL